MLIAVGEEGYIFFVILFLQFIIHSLPNIILLMFSIITKKVNDIKKIFMYAEITVFICMVLSYIFIRIYALLKYI